MKVKIHNLSSYDGIFITDVIIKDYILTLKNNDNVLAVIEFDRKYFSADLALEG
jgi:hypothetical protein